MNNNIETWMLNYEKNIAKYVPHIAKYWTIFYEKIVFGKWTMGIQKEDNIHCNKTTCYIIRHASYDYQASS